MREHPADVHGIAAPKVPDSVGLDNEHEVCEELAIGELPPRCLHRQPLTTKRYLTLSTGAMKVLLRAPAMPPEMKLFVILRC